MYFFVASRMSWKNLQTIHHDISATNHAATGTLFSLHRPLVHCQPVNLDWLQGSWRREKSSSQASARGPEIQQIDPATKQNLSMSKSCDGQCFDKLFFKLMVLWSLCLQHLRIFKQLYQRVPCFQRVWQWFRFASVCSNFGAGNGATGLGHVKMGKEMCFEIQPFDAKVVWNASRIRTAWVETSWWKNNGT